MTSLDWPEFKNRKIGQIIMCTGGSCGNISKGAHLVPFKKIKEELKNNKVSHKFKVTTSSCLGVCKPHNVSVVLSKDKQIWLGMLRDEKVYQELSNWIIKSAKTDKLLPIPETLLPYVFDRFELF